MGVLNVTPDSFSDGGKFAAVNQALAHAYQLIDEGADIIDVGGESTRPGVMPVPASEQLRRLLPVLRGLRDASVPLSVDTADAEVMRTVLDHGASIINDVQALQCAAALRCVAEGNCGVVLMHMKNNPREMQLAPSYDEVVPEVRDFLRSRVSSALSAGINLERIVVDPGFGFGKRPEDNWRLLRSLNQAGADLPLLVGLSRKSMLGHATGRPVADRLVASVIAAVLAAERGALILRVHDVAATRDGLAVLAALNAAPPFTPGDFPPD